MILLRGVAVDYGPRRVLRDIDLEVEKGEVVALMGSSGGGKTTLLKATSGLIPIAAGTVTVDGISVVADGERARERMGMVFQGGALLDYMTVGENIAFALHRRGVRGKELTERIAQALELAVLGPEVAAKMPDQLSGGMKKRAGIARAICLRPQVLLYDEPTTGLDPVTTYQIDETIRHLREEAGVTSLVVSHDLQSVRRIADRVAFLHQGEIVFLGPPSELLTDSHPAIRDTVSKALATSLSGA